MTEVVELAIVVPGPVFDPVLETAEVRRRRESVRFWQRFWQRFFQLMILAIIGVLVLIILGAAGVVPEPFP